MTTSRAFPRVLIIGGGIGGLCLAHGLRNAGIPVTVFERTTHRDDWLQGYRIHVNPDGSHALHSCLPPANWDAFVRTVSDAGDGFGFVTERLGHLLDLPRETVNRGTDDPAEAHHGVSRIRLREALLAGLDGTIEFGRTFTGYTVEPGGRVTAHFADGGSATGDLLVGADGANSRVRSQFLPAADRIDTGVVAIAGKYRLDAGRRAVLPPELTRRANTVIPTGSGFLFTAVWEPDPALYTGDGPLPDDAVPYTFWAYADAAERLDTAGRDGAALAALVGERIADWHPALRGLVAGADPATINVIQVRSAPDTVEAWRPGPVTLLGDAIHSMTPMAGIGANTALRDADLLRRTLIDVAGGARGLVPAVGDYETQMREYGFAAVRLSLRNARQAASPKRLSRTMFRTVLRVANAVPPMKRAMFADTGRAPDDAGR